MAIPRRAERRVRRLLIATLLVAAACSGGSRRQSTADSKVPATLAQVSTMAALGDSVPYGTACNCTPYPQLSADDVARVAKHSVDSSNDAVPGFLSSDVLPQLQNNQTAIAHVEHADATLIEVGANDVAYSSTCGTNVSCYEAKLPRVVDNITAIVARVRELAAGHHVAIALLDYWSVWLGGKYEEAQGPAYVSAADTLTHAFNDDVRSVAHATGSIYVDVRTAFRGPNGEWDETNLLAGDGDHPNAAGHERIAQAVAQTVVADLDP